MPGRSLTWRFPGFCEFGGGRIETEFETEKGDVGLDEYETRSWAGWHHHIAMCLLGGTFLLGLQQDLREIWRSLRARRGTGWCGGCYPGKGLDQTSCCAGWRRRRIVTNGPSAPMPSAAPHFVHPSLNRRCNTRAAQLFQSVTQGTCIYQFRKAQPNSSPVNISVNNDALTIADLRFAQIERSAIKDLYPGLLCIPRIGQGSVSTLEKIAADHSVKPLREYVWNISQGDLNLTTHSKHFSEDPTSGVLAWSKYGFLGNQVRYVQRVLRRGPSASSKASTQKSASMVLDSLQATT